MSRLILTAVFCFVHVAAFAESLQMGTTISARSDVTVTGSVTLVAAENSSRSALSCTNTSGSVNVRWGDSSVAAAVGQRIAFGAAIEIRNTSAVYMVSEGANVTVSCTEETR